MIDVRVIGAGLAGCEAALQLTRFGLHVELVDMKPDKKSPAHTMNDLAELVCSNSLKSMIDTSASGLLKQELRLLGSELLKSAECYQVPAGSALATDRKLFAADVTEKIKSNSLISFRSEEVLQLPDDDIPTIIATGPLTSEALYRDIEQFSGEDKLHFFDAIAPIVSTESLRSDSYYRAARYGKGGDDYINCPLNKEEYLRFRHELINAKCAPVRDFDNLLFADCQPIEELARKGEDTMRFGPLRPKGLTDPRSGKTPYAVLQLRQENAEGNMYSLVGCQTRLVFSEQKRVFSLIPALADAEYLRYGVMHRNVYINAPNLLNLGFSVKANDKLFFAGQISGVEGYVESIASGLMAAHQLAARVYLYDREESLALLPSETTVSGAIARYLVNASEKNFQPMNANFGLLPLPEETRLKKADRSVFRRDRSLESISQTVANINELITETKNLNLKSSYYYEISQDLIAEEGSLQRDQSRLLVYSAKETRHMHFRDLTQFLMPGDLLVMNDTRVIPARLYGTREATGAKIECFLLKEVDSEGPVWNILAKPARRCQVGDRIIFSPGILEAEVIGSFDQGERRLRFTASKPFEGIVDHLGVMPLPPYIHKELEDPERYQTVYAKNRGSVAAPTAGLHFTPELISELKSVGVEIANLTLHVGIGTFRPVKSDSILDHKMHSEEYILSQETADAIMKAKNRGSRVIAVGTTSLRVLEAVALRQGYPDSGQKLLSEKGETDIFIHPPYRFRIIDGLITNFHLPESTLLMLVSALVGRKKILALYREAIERKYRFYSFGDAMLLLPERKGIS